MTGPVHPARAAGARRWPWYLADPRPSGGRPKILLALAVALLATGVWGACYQSSFRSLGYPDANDYAQLGRQLYRGEGFTSQQTFPYIIGWLGGRGFSTEAPWPNLHRFPLPTLLNALAFRLVGVGDFGAVLPCGAFFVASCVVVFLLGNRIFGPLVGLVAAALTVISNSQIHYSLSGLTESGTAFFIAAMALAYARVVDSDARAKLPALVLGTVIGIGFLQRYNLVLLAGVSGMLLIAGPERRGWRPVLLAAACAWLCVAPWFVFNFDSYDSPLVYLTSDRNLLLGMVRGDVFNSLRQYDAWSLAFENSDILLRKLSRGWLQRHWYGMFGREFACLGPLALAAVVTLRSRKAAGLWLFTAGAIAVTLAAYSATVVVQRFFVPFAPLLLVIVTGSAATLLRKLPRRAHLVVPVAALALVFAFGGDLSARLARRTPKRPAAEQAFDVLQRLVAPRTLIAAAASWKLAWYCDRPSIRFQGNLQQLDMIDRYFARVGAVYFGRRRARRFKQELARSPLADAFPVVHALPHGALLWLRRDDGGRSS